MTIHLSWRHLIEADDSPLGFNIYRDLLGFTETTLPDILVSLDGTVDWYLDATVDGSSIYYYMIEIIYPSRTVFHGPNIASEVDALLWDNRDELEISRRIAQEDGFLLLVEKIR